MPDALLVKDKSDAEKPIKISAYRTGVRKTEAHRHNNYFEIVFFTAGGGTHTIDQFAYEVRPPVVFFIRRDQVHHIDLDENIDPEGFVLIIKAPFVQRCIDPELKKLLAASSSLSCLYLSEQRSVARLFELIEEENNHTPQYAQQQHCLEGLLKALMVKLINTATPGAAPQNFRTDVCSAFRELLSQSSAPKKNVGYYADMLNTTPQNLNAVCRKHSGQSASQVIAEFIINEARRLLVYTDCTISEIAFQLNFSDASHFVKYFKRYSGTTPQTYRLQAL